MEEIRLSEELYQQIQFLKYMQERALTEHNRGDILNLQEILVKQWDIKNKEKVMD